MKSRHRDRQDRRPQRRPLKPEERVGLHRVALEYRAALRAETTGNGNDSVAAPVVVEQQADGEAERRARYAAAVARAEFGRFYWKKEPSGRKALRNKGPRSNGAAGPG